MSDKIIIADISYPKEAKPGDVVSIVFTIKNNGTSPCVGGYWQIRDRQTGETLNGQSVMLDCGEEYTYNLGPFNMPNKDIHYVLETGHYEDSTSVIDDSENIDISIAAEKKEEIDWKKILMIASLTLAGVAVLYAVVKK